VCSRRTVLATCIETDPRCGASLLGLEGHNQHIAVHRERRAAGRDRVDLLISVDGRDRALIEVKVLSGRAQLTRYGDAFSTIDPRVLLYPGRLPLDVNTAPGWRGLTWERLLDALGASTDPWVARTATSWSSHLRAALPTVDASTRWNDLEYGRRRSGTPSTPRPWPAPPTRT